VKKGAPEQVVGGTLRSGLIGRFATFSHHGAEYFGVNQYSRITNWSALPEIHGITVQIPLCVLYKGASRCR
jgi:hypothetical protein